MNEIPNLTLKQERKLLKIAKEGQGKAKANAIRLLVWYNQKIIKYIARGYSSFGGKIEYDDLVQEGISSIPKAIEKFDTKFKCRFSTYAIPWARQFFQTFIKKNQFINQGSDLKEKKSLLFYDGNYWENDKDGKSYSLADTLNDSENTGHDMNQVHQKDTIIQTNNLINSLGNREEILLVRLWHKIKPSNLLDVYYLATEEEKEILKKKVKSGKKFTPNLLQKYSLEEEKYSSLPVAETYLKKFTEKYKASGLVKELNKSENAIRKLKQEIFKKLQELARKRNLHFLIE
jgi:RNA polymerase sigma factor (sigma-70 family)